MILLGAIVGRSSCALGPHLAIRLLPFVTDCIASPLGPINLGRAIGTVGARAREQNHRCGKEEGAHHNSFVELAALVSLIVTSGLIVARISPELIALNNIGAYCSPLASNRRLAGSFCIRIKAVGKIAIGTSRNTRTLSPNLTYSTLYGTHSSINDFAVESRLARNASATTRSRGNTTRWQHQQAEDRSCRNRTECCQYV